MSTSTSAMTTHDYVIPSQTVGDFIADAIGRKFETRSKIVHDKGTVVGPLGLMIPLEWRFSHGHSTRDYSLACWKVSGQLYLSVAFEKGSHTTTVILIDKGKLEQMFGRMNLITAATKGSSANEFGTLDGYIEWFKDVIVGVWVKHGMSADYTKVAL